MFVVGEGIHSSAPHESEHQGDEAYKQHSPDILKDWLALNCCHHKGSTEDKRKNQQHPFGTLKISPGS